MVDSADNKWKELLMEFVHDVATHLTYIQSYGDMLEWYLEALVQQENLPAVLIIGDKNMTPDTALEMLRIMREHAKLLRERKDVMRDAVGLGIGPFKGPESS